MLDATVLVRKTATSVDRFSVFSQPCASAFAFQLFEKACLCATPGLVFEVKHMDTITVISIQEQTFNANPAFTMRPWLILQNGDTTCEISTMFSLASWQR